MFLVDEKTIAAVDLDSGEVDVRFFFSEEEISIFVDDVMVYWYCLSDSSWEIQPALKLYSIGDNVLFTKINRVELHDKREAIWIDHESTASSAIADVIQQRPVFVISKSSRYLSFTYQYGEDVIEAAFPSTVTETHQENKQVSSDAIVYSSDVFISSNLQTAIEEGLLVKILKLSELDYGQVRASSAMQKSAIEAQRKIGVKDRLIIALEANDIYRVNKLMSGSQRPVVFDLIVEDIDISVSDGEFGMSVSGRKVIS